MSRTYELNDLVLTIEQDDPHESPRDWDNIGTMVCFHRRYNLGDKHKYRDQEDFILSLAQELGVETQVETEEYEWEDRPTHEIFEECKQHIVILPLYLYDHSGITMNTTGFSCPWDSGQVGWIYATKERFIKETGYTERELFSDNKHRMVTIGEHVKVTGEDRDFGKVIAIDGDIVTVDFDYNKTLSHRNPMNIVMAKQTEIAEVMYNRAVEILKGEVETYDQYLTGDVYWFKIEKKVKCECCQHVEMEEIDSCGGFYGSDPLENGILDHIGKEWEEVIKNG